MPFQPEAVPCEVCGATTTFTGTKRCNNCWEVEGRLGEYLRSPRGLEAMIAAVSAAMPKREGALPWAPISDARCHAAADKLDAAGRHYGWWKLAYPSWRDADPISRSEFLGVVEEILRAGDAAAER